MQTASLSETIKRISSETSSSWSACNQKTPENGSFLMCLPTGAGKTVVFGFMARLWPRSQGRIMMISHRFEINKQAVNTISKICGEYVDWEQANREADNRAERARIVVASMQTMVSAKTICGERVYRMQKFDPHEFGLVIIDEAHRLPANSYQLILRWFQENPNLVVLGPTATPIRSDGIGLGSQLETVLCNKQLDWGIENGWLCPIKQRFAVVEHLDISKVGYSTYYGERDLSQTQLGKAILQDRKAMAEMVEPLIKECEDRTTAIFTPSIDVSKEFARLINNFRPRKAAALYSGISPAEREDILEGYAAGDIQYVTNVDVLSEGYDNHMISAVVMLGPTRSTQRYSQRVGRGTRPLPGVVDPWDSPALRRAAIANSRKEDLLVLDFSCNAGNHRLVHTGNLLAGDDPPEVQDRIRDLCIDNEFDGDALEARQIARREHEERQRRNALKVRVRGVKYRVYDKDELPNFRPRRMAPWKRKLDVSINQLKMLRRLGVSEKAISKLTNMGEASYAIDYRIRNPINGFGRWLLGVKRQEEPEKWA